MPPLSPPSLFEHPPKRSAAKRSREIVWIIRFIFIFVIC